LIIDFDQRTPRERYIQTIQTLIPRPIAWVLSENENGSFNLAPFSFFTAVCADPALVMLSLGHKPDGNLKDTRTNLESRGHCVIHIPDRSMLEAMNASSATLDAGESEVDKLGLKLTDFDNFRLPRLADAKVAYGCSLYRIEEIGAGPQSLIFAEIQRLYIDDAILEPRDDDRIKVDTMKLDPVARLGANEYAFLHEVTHLRRPD